MHQKEKLLSLRVHTSHVTCTSMDVIVSPFAGCLQVSVLHDVSAVMTFDWTIFGIPSGNSTNWRTAGRKVLLVLVIVRAKYEAKRWDWSFFA